MKIVLDTNVLVSAFLSPNGTPAKILDAALNGRVVVLFDGRILAEYREVLAREELGLDATAVAAALDLIVLKGVRIASVPLNLSGPDPDDFPFVEVAVSGQADALVTGNAKHFPDTRGVALLSPRALLDRL